MRRRIARGREEERRSQGLFPPSIELKSQELELELIKLLRGLKEEALTSASVGSLPSSTRSVSSWVPFIN